MPSILTGLRVAAGLAVTYARASAILRLSGCSQLLCVVAIGVAISILGLTYPVPPLAAVLLATLIGAVGSKDRMSR